jgi:hypothetical protein
MWSKKLPIAEYSVVKKLDHRGFAATAGKPFRTRQTWVKLRGLPAVAP